MVEPCTEAPVRLRDVEAVRERVAEWWTLRCMTERWRTRRHAPRPLAPATPTPPAGAGYDHEASRARHRRLCAALQAARAAGRDLTPIELTTLRGEAVQDGPRPIADEIGRLRG